LFVSLIHEEGMGGKDQDDGLAFKYYKQSAEGDYAPAQVALGVWYEDGRPLPLEELAKRKANKTKTKEKEYKKTEKEEAKEDEEDGETEDDDEEEEDLSNPAEAFKWYKKAAEEHNSDEAYSKLGLLYEEGMGVEQDNAAAFSCYKKAADLNHGAAMQKVGMCYEYGLVGTLLFSSSLFLPLSSCRRGPSPRPITQLHSFFCAVFAGSQSGRKRSLQLVPQVGAAHF
jgi:TPR repeat protein